MSKGLYLEPISVVIWQVSYKRRGMRPLKMGQGPLVVMYLESLSSMLSWYTCTDMIGEGRYISCEVDGGTVSQLVLGSACQATQLAQSIVQESVNLQPAENSELRLIPLGTKDTMHVPLLCWAGIHMNSSLWSESGWVVSKTSTQSSLYERCDGADGSSSFACNLSRFFVSFLVLGGAQGLAGWSDDVRELGVDSVTDNSSDVIGSVSSEQMGKGSGKGGGWILHERLVTWKIQQKGLLWTQEVGSCQPLSETEIGWPLQRSWWWKPEDRENSRGILMISGPAIGSTATTGLQNRHWYPLSNGWKGNNPLQPVQKPPLQ